MDPNIWGNNFFILYIIEFIQSIKNREQITGIKNDILEAKCSRVCLVVINLLWSVCQISSMHHDVGLDSKICFPSTSSWIHLLVLKNIFLFYTLLPAATCNNQLFPSLSHGLSPSWPVLPTLTKILYLHWTDITNVGHYLTLKVKKRSISSAPQSPPSYNLSISGFCIVIKAL